MSASREVSGSGGASAPGFLGGFDAGAGAGIVAPADVAPGALVVTVSEPQQHGDGTSGFVSYLITTETTLPCFPFTRSMVRRRFQDFRWLQRVMTDELPQCIVPPLPSKHRVGYLTRDRFTSEFIDKRRISLQTYLNRVARHPSLSHSKALVTFLDKGNLFPQGAGDPGADGSNGSHVGGASTHSGGSQMLENLSDALMNAFSKVKNPDERFVRFRSELSVFEKNLQTVEKLHLKLLRQQHEQEQELSEMSASLSALAKLEDGLARPLTATSGAFDQLATACHTKSSLEDTDFLSNLHDYINYCGHVKDVLKLRDHKQAELEELTTYLQFHIVEREKTLASQRTGGIGGYVKEKYRDLRGMDHEQARLARLGRLDVKIKELHEGLDTSRQTSHAFSDHVLAEMALFERHKALDFENFLRDYRDHTIDYYRTSADVWTQLLHQLEQPSPPASATASPGATASVLG